MVKKIVVGTLIAIPGLVVLYAATWMAASCGLLGEIPFGYYRDFYLVKHAVTETPCVKSGSYSRHEDTTLEDFHFTVRTTSDRLVRLWFQYNQDVSRMCSNPQGLLVVKPGRGEQDQLYRIESIADRLGGKDIKSVSIQDILCHIDELAPLFEANYSNDSIPFVTWQQQYYTEDFRAFLRLEITGEQPDGGWVETPIDE
jgi:hypothetical protein